MEQIIFAKMNQCEEMRDTLSVLFGHPVNDRYWDTAYSTEYSAEATVKTSPRAWTGRNIMGDIIARAAGNF